jgi:hypothetical protein
MARLNSDYIKNLLFQKNNYPEVFKSYAKDDTCSDCDIVISARESKYFYVYVPEDADIQIIISELFLAKIIFSQTVNTCVILFGYENSVIHTENGISTVEINHPWLSRNQQIVVSKVLYEPCLKKCCDFCTYKRSQLKQLERIKIQNYIGLDSDIHDVTDRDDLLNYLMQAKALYKLDIKCNGKVHKGHLKDIVCSDDAILMTIDTIKEAISNKKVQEDEIISKCYKVLKEYFLGKSVELIGRYLEIGDFFHNYSVVEKSFDYVDAFESELKDFLMKKTRKTIHELRTNCEKYTTLYNSLSDDDNIRGLGRFMENQLDKLRSVLEECS